MKRNKKTPNFTTLVDKIISVEVDVQLSKYISERIKTIQKEKKISSKKMCENGDFSNESSVARIRKGNHIISIETLYLVCKNLDCKSSDILPF
jgi:DNA-binding Xre family transcriptional regulator